MTQNDNIFTQEEIAAGNAPDPNLPPAGYARDEELLRRQDALEAKLDALLGKLDIQSINPATFKEDREIQYALTEKNDGLGVTDREPGYEYCWARAAGDDSQQVWRRKSRGWEVVQGNMKECSHLKIADGTRRIGDVLLLRIRMDRHLMNVREDRERTLKRQFGAEAEVHGFAASHPNAFGRIESTNDDPTTPTMQKTLQRGAQKAAMQQVDGMLRKGNVPGMPVKGGR